MGLFDRLFGPVKSNTAMRGYFQTLTAYQPVFYSRSGGLYEMDQTRAAIHAIATHCSKLKPNVSGAGNARLERQLQFRPNPWQDTTKFLYRTATILEAENTVFLVPVLDVRGRTVGAYPILPSACALMEGEDGITYLRFRFFSGKYAAIEYDRCGVLTKMQYRDDMFGESNAALNPTLDLINIQNQGIENGIRQSAALRFMAKLGTTLRDEDVSKERERFVRDNLAAENNGGVLMFDTKYAEVKQIESKPYIVDDKQMDIINKNVQSYFGVNDKILRNEFDEATWSAFYEAKVESFALQLSLVMTNMFFTDKQLAMGCEILWSANRLQFASTADKVEIITQLFDRGMLNRDEGREIMQMPPLPNGEGQKYYIRGEYVESEKKTAQELSNAGNTGREGGKINAGDKQNTA